MGVTVNEIAKRCGVSRTTVLRALNNQNRVSEKTRIKIINTANELGYRPNLLARSLNTGHTMMLGVVAISMENFVFVQTLDAINKATERKGYSLNIALHGRNSEHEIARIREFADRRMEGILISPYSKGTQFEDFLLSLGIPVVCIGNAVGDRISTVMIDEAKAAEDAVNLILSKGYERILFICPPLCYQDEQNVYTHLKRAAGFERMKALHPERQWEIISGNDYLAQLAPALQARKARTAILCSGDLYALHIMRYFKQNAMKTPQDVGIMGFDNINILDYIVPRLTTVSTNVEQVATVAVNELLSQITDGVSMPKRIVLPHIIMDMDTL